MSHRFMLGSIDLLAIETLRAVYLVTAAWQGPLIGC